MNRRNALKVMAASPAALYWSQVQDKTAQGYKYKQLETWEFDGVHIAIATPHNQPAASLASFQSTTMGWHILDYKFLMPNKVATLYRVIVWPLGDVIVTPNGHRIVTSATADDLRRILETS